MDEIKQRPRALRKGSTETETRLWAHLRNRRLDGFKFRRQQPVGKYIVDFVNLEGKLIIEVDGGQHSSEAGYDKARDEWLESRGYRVLRFWDNDVFNNLEGVLERIREALHTTPHPNPSIVGAHGIACVGNAIASAEAADAVAPPRAKPAEPPLQEKEESPQARTAGSRGTVPSPSPCPLPQGEREP